RPPDPLAGPRPSVDGEGHAPMERGVVEAVRGEDLDGHDVQGGRVARALARPLDEGPSPELGVAGLQADAQGTDALVDQALKADLRQQAGVAEDVAEGRPGQAAIDLGDVSGELQVQDPVARGTIRFHWLGLGDRAQQERGERDDPTMLACEHEVYRPLRRYRAKALIPSQAREKAPEEVLQPPSSSPPALLYRSKKLSVGRGMPCLGSEKAEGLPCESMARTDTR